MSYLVRGFLVWLALLALSSPAFAWVRTLRPDAQLVQESELIVVGRLKRNTVRPNTETDGRAGNEHLAVLVVTAALKGRCGAKEITILFHYGLTPSANGRIFDTGNSAISVDPVVRDACQDHLWFLRKSNGPFERGAVSHHPSICEPDEVQPVSLRPYYAAHLARSPEKAMKALRGEPGSVGKLAECYLDLQEAERARKLPDAAARAERFLPYYAKTLPWWNVKGPEQDQMHWLHMEAEEVLVACGEEGGKQLGKLFDDPGHSLYRSDIIDLWGEARYRGGVAPLVTLLQEHERFWAAGSLWKAWWQDKKSPLAKRGWAVANESLHAVTALARIGDDRAREAIRMTRKRWRAMDAPPPEKGAPPAVADECDWALKELGRYSPTLP